MKKLPLFLALAVVSAGAPAQLLDFEGFDAGTMMTDQYAGIGIDISTMNFTGPDMAIIFDSANPTGGDTDLATPGYHATNTEALGKILIIAEDVVDADNNGLVDDPDDEGSQPAGWIQFEMAFNSSAGSITLVDIEEQGGTLTFFQSGSTPIQSIEIPAIGDNSVQTIDFTGFDYDRMRVNLAGSGAIGSFEPVPEPASMLALGAGVALLLRRRRARA